jgi:hypothetical protein
MVAGAIPMIEAGALSSFAFELIATSACGYSGAGGCCLEAASLILSASTAQFLI